MDDNDQFDEDDDDNFDAYLQEYVSRYEQHHQHEQIEAEKTSGKKRRRRSEKRRRKKHHRPDCRFSSRNTGQRLRRATMSAMTTSQHIGSHVSGNGQRPPKKQHRHKHKGKYDSRRCV